MSTALKQLKAEIENQQNLFKVKAQAAFKEATQEVFEAFPNLQSFSWTQYTPYFNDGHECVFGVRGDYPSINGVDGDEISEAWGYQDKHYPARNPELIPAQTAVKELLGSLPDEIYKDLFGDHVEVIVTRDGVTTEEYSHD